MFTNGDDSMSRAQIGIKRMYVKNETCSYNAVAIKQSQNLAILVRNAVIEFVWPKVFSLKLSVYSFSFLFEEYIRGKVRYAWFQE